MTDLVPPDPPLEPERRRPPEWHPSLGDRARAALSDWRYPAALAAAMLCLSVVIAQLITVRGQGQVLDRLTDRATIADGRARAAECVDQLEATFDRLIVDLVLLADSDPSNDPVATEDEVRRALRDVTSEAAVTACYDAEAAAVANAAQDG
jgi:hypothetical protein